MKSMIVIIVTVVTFFLITIAAAEENQDDRTLSPYFFIEDGDSSVDKFPLKETDVTVNISGVIADVVIKQKYYNGGTRPINARYIFPASTRAAVHSMKMIIGEEVIVAQVKERQAAQQEFDKAKKEGMSASLVKQQRPNVFSMNVANILPNDTIDIELRYTELLVPTEKIYEFVYPTVVGPRYSNQPEATAPETDLWVKNPYLEEDQVSQTSFNISLSISTGIALQEIVCTSHETDVIWKSESVATILLVAPEDFGGNRDFIVRYRLAGQEIASGLLLFEGQEENFFLLMVQPPERIKPADIPPREYIFVVDVSGSMHGFPLNTAKKLLKNLIGNLRAVDRFNVVLFAGGSRLMSPSSLPGTRENIRKAIRVIDRQQGGGGTELRSALQKALSLPRSESFSRTTMVVTDGYIAAERDVFHLIQNNLNRTNVFSFGIGSSVNRYLIEGMARAGQGEPFIVTKPQEAQGEAERFRTYVGAPTLTNIAVKYDGFETYDIEPPAIPDLFAERPLVVFGKWRGKPEGTIELAGLGGAGEYIQTIPVAETKPLKMNRALRYLWARTRIARILDYSLGRRNREDELEITNLGLTYNLLTRYTSFIAVHEAVRNSEPQSEDVTQPLPLPLHVSNLAVGGGAANVPEPELYMLLVVASLILLIPLMRNRIRRSSLMKCR
ncbi:MAG: VWA domain-containing protein [Deltaproteobacteria bacterium]|nr:MAG: VWA domain-containing protein [Deltaproteobacteria bacterium]